MREQCLAKERLLKDTIQEIQQEADKLAVLAGSKSNTNICTS